MVLSREVYKNMFLILRKEMLFVGKRNEKIDNLKIWGVIVEENRNG